MCFIEGNGTLSVFSPGRNPSRGGESTARPNYLLLLRERRVMKSWQSLPPTPAPDPKTQLIGSATLWSRELLSEGRVWEKNQVREKQKVRRE